MSYSTIFRCANDTHFRGRITACAAQEHAADPDAAAEQLMWPVSSATDIEAAYASAIAAGNPEPGGDESVITDQMILSAVQANLPVPG
jgi:hypothetical protein